MDPDTDTELVKTTTGDNVWPPAPSPTTDGPDLFDADTGERIGSATEEQIEASDAAAAKDGGAGIFRVDRTTGAVSTTGRRVYTEPRDKTAG